MSFRSVFIAVVIAFGTSWGASYLIVRGLRWRRSNRLRT